MRPVHELTEDQAVLELEEVCDTLADPTSGLNTEPLRKRKAELEAWILMHQVTPKPEPEPTEEPEPMPAHKKHRTEEEKAEAKREYQRNWLAKRKAQTAAATKVSHRKKQVAPPPQLEVDEKPAKVKSPLAKEIDQVVKLRARVSSIRREVWLLMAELEGIPGITQETFLASDLALLDAAAHAAHQLALGRLEVA